MDRSISVFSGYKTGLNPLEFRPVHNRSRTGLYFIISYILDIYYKIYQ